MLREMFSENGSRYAGGLADGVEVDVASEACVDEGHGPRHFRADQASELTFRPLGEEVPEGLYDEKPEGLRQHRFTTLGEGPTFGLHHRYERRVASMSNRYRQERGRSGRTPARDSEVTSATHHDGPSSVAPERE